MRLLWAAVSKMVRLQNECDRLQAWFLVGGEEMIGFKEHNTLSNDGVHPSDHGDGIIATKLSLVFKQAFGL